MRSSAQFLSPAEAARRLGVSVKALRLYEQRGLLMPRRTEAGWRVYGPDEMACAGEIVALRALGLSLAEIGRALAGNVPELERALTAHQGRMEGEIGRISDALARVRGLRADLVRGQVLGAGELAQVLGRTGAPVVSFELPWPWGGEVFELPSLAPLTYIIGPLGSGKTRLAQRLAAELPGGVFVDLDRANRPVDATGVERALTWMVDEGATASPALTALIAALETAGDGPIVVDMVEHQLDQATQEALMVWLRQRGASERPLLLMTRSSAILDLALVGASESIIFCPANHSPPVLVAPFAGAVGYEAMASCLATPEVRARSEGVVVIRREAAPG